MPLVAATLQSALVRIAQSFPSSYVEAGRQWADAYATYAQGAVSVLAGSPLAIEAARPILAGSMGFAFASGFEANVTANQMASAVTAFWMAPPMAFAGASPGVVTLVGMAPPALASSLVAAFIANSASQAGATQAVQRIAALLDAHARTVIVTHFTPTGPVLGPLV